MPKYPTKSITIKNYRQAIRYIGAIIADKSASNMTREQARFALHYLNMPQSRPAKEYEIGDVVAHMVVVYKHTAKEYRVKCRWCGRERAISRYDLRVAERKKPRWCSRCTLRHRQAAIESEPLKKAIKLPPKRVDASSPFR